MLSVAMIVKNEVNTLRKTVETVRPFVDEVVIGVDTKSTDGTLELSKELADKVVPINLSEELALKASVVGIDDWGFSAARNLVFDACDKLNWRLVLDGHEVVHNPEKLQPVVNEAAVIGCTGVEVPVHFEPDEFGVPSQIYKQVRLMDSEVRYRNPIHNVPVVKRVHTSEDLYVEHRKQDQEKVAKEERDAQRTDSTINGLLKAVVDNPGNSRSWFYLGNSYKENGLYEEAIHAYKEYLKIATWKEERWHARANMGTCFKALGDLNEARKSYVKAISEYPAMAEAYYYLAHMAYQVRDYHEAQVWLEKCVELGMPNGKLFMSPKIYLVDRYDLLSMVYHHLGWPGKAIEQAEKALENVDNPRIKNNVSKWKDSLNKYDAAYYDEVWKKNSKPSQLEKQRIQRIASELTTCESVLDVGSGPGWLCEELDKDIIYFGVDISEYCVGVIKEKEGLATTDMDLLGPLRFEGCVFGEILEHVEDPKSLLLRVKHYLHDEAIVVASVPRYGAMYDKAHARDYTEEEFKELLSVLGEPERMGTLGPWLLYKVEVVK